MNTRARSRSVKEVRPPISAPEVLPVIQSLSDAFDASPSTLKEIGSTLGRILKEVSPPLVEITVERVEVNGDHVNYVLTVNSLRHEERIRAALPDRIPPGDSATAIVLPCLVAAEEGDRVSERPTVVVRVNLVPKAGSRGLHRVSCWLIAAVLGCLYLFLEVAQLTGKRTELGEDNSAWDEEYYD